MISIPTSNRILQYFLKKIDQLIALSTAVRSVYVEQGYDSTHIEVIPNMVDPSFSVTGSNIIQSQNSERKILYVGELSEKKGVDHLIRAISRLPDTYHLTVVGDGAQREYLEELIVDLGIRDQVTFKGQVSYKRIPQQYSLADVFVHPGVWPEPFGRTVLEAMQASLPVVCTRIGGPADLIQESELQVPPANTKALSMAIEQAYRQRDEIGEQNRRYVASKFTPDAIINQILSLYKNLC
jgi:glycosyltransferase involved in cell wall biosynthesis